MKFKRLFDHVLVEFDSTTALCVVQIYSINLLLKPKESEILGKKSFEDRIIKKARKLLWEVDERVVLQAIDIWRVVHSWEIQQSLGGLGGSQPKTFRQLLEDHAKSP